MWNWDLAESPERSEGANQYTGCEGKERNCHAMDIRSDVAKGSTESGDLWFWRPGCPERSSHRVCVHFHLGQERIARLIQNEYARDHNDKRQRRGAFKELG
jgi:hypothetical protein